MAVSNLSVADAAIKLVSPQWILLGRKRAIARRHGISIQSEEGSMNLKHYASW